MDLLKKYKKYLVAMVIASFWLWIWFSIVNPYLERKPFYRNYEVTTEIEKDGKTYKIVGHIACKKVSPMREFIPFPWEGTNYTATNSTIGYRLPNGEGLLVRPENLGCDIGGHLSGYEVPFYPMVYWLDNSEKPKEIEVYFHKSYYQSPKARLKVKNYKVTELGTSLLSKFSKRDLDPGTEIKWFSENRDVVFIGYYATIVNKDHWMQIADLHSRINHFNKVVQLPYGFFSHAEYKELYKNFAFTFRSCRNVNLKMFGRQCGGVFNTFSLKRRNHVFNLEDNKSDWTSGVLYLYPIKRQEKPIARQQMEVGIYGEKFSTEAQFLNKFIYSPKYQELFRIEEHELSREYLVRY